MDINLTPSSHHPPKRPQHSNRPIEYSTIAEEAQEKKKRSFLRWRKDKQRTKSQPSLQAKSPDLIPPYKSPAAQPPPPPAEESPDLLKSFQKKDPELGLHGAPRHEKEEKAPDLLLAATTPQETAEHPAPRRHRDDAPDLTATRAGGERKRPSVPPPPPKKEKEPILPGINLIPDHLLALQGGRNRFRDLLYVAVTVIAVILSLYGGLNIYQQKITTDTAEINSEIVEIDREIVGFEETQRNALAVQDRLEALQAILDAHIYWTPFLEEIEELTLPTVYYESMHGSATTGQFVFEAVAADYSQIEAQVRLLRRSSFVEGVQTTSASAISATIAEEQEQSEAAALSSPPVTFTMTVVFDPSLFHRQSVEQP